MAYFHGRVDNFKNKAATRRGYKDTGITARVDSWNIGGKIHIEHDERINLDIIHFYLTNGFNNSDKLVASFAKDLLTGEIKLLQIDYPELLLWNSMEDCYVKNEKGTVWHKITINW